MRKLGFERFTFLYDAGITLILLFSGVLPWLDSLLSQYLGDSLHRSVLFLVIVMGFSSILHAPLNMYFTFRIEGAFGFNRQTLRSILGDSLKSLILGVGIGVPLLYLLFGLLQYSDPQVWIWASVIVIGMQILFMIIYPLFIAPLFNQFKPLEAGSLKQSILALAQRLHFPASEIYVMDGSRRSLHSNAYFTGFGKWRRIVLFDTLIEQLNEEELVAVVAHEIGHYKLRHIYIRMGIGAIFLLGFFFLATKAIHWSGMYSAFGFSTPLDSQGAFPYNPAVGMFLFMTLFQAMSFLLSPLQNFLSQQDEFAADSFAAKAMGASKSLGLGLIKLAQKNLSFPNPHRGYALLFHSHPSLELRLRALGRVQEEKIEKNSVFG